MNDTITVTVNGHQISITLAKPTPVDFPPLPSMEAQVKDLEAMNEDKASTITDLCNRAYGAVYPFHPTGWEYPGDAINTLIANRDGLKKKVAELEIDKERRIAEIGDMKRESVPIGAASLANRLARVREAIDNAYFAFVGTGKTIVSVTPIEIEFSKIRQALGSDTLNPITEAVAAIEAAHFELVCGRSDEERPDVADVGQHLDQIAVALGAEPPRDQLNKETYGR